MGGQLDVPESRFQHFLNFSSLKQPGTIRVGTFGDSHTFGAEVDKTESYPYQLQELFKKKFPNKKVEVLNFGKNGSGFQEQFFLWEKYAKSYELDYILISPRGLYASRDLGFSVIWKFAVPKSRFILSKDKKLDLVHIIGDTLEERYKNYYKLIPSWTTFRYDKQPFRVLKEFFPFLDAVRNPFYYIKISDEEEFVKINIIMLEKIKSLYNKKILFFTDPRFN